MMFKTRRLGSGPEMALATAVAILPDAVRALGGLTVARRVTGMISASIEASRGSAFFQRGAFDSGHRERSWTNTRGRSDRPAKVCRMASRTTSGSRSFTQWAAGKGHFQLHW